MITQKQRDAYRFALEDKGMPEVLAFMAAENLTAIFKEGSMPGLTLFNLLCSGFYWETDWEEWEFWEFVGFDCRPA